ncbi:MAG: hypothetical protein WBD95_18830 [Xanthobacteraceae bacterium]
MARLTKTQKVSIICALIGAAAIISASFLRAPSFQQTINGDNNFQVGSGATLTMAQLLPTVGSDSVVIGNVKHNVGDRSVAIGATDDRGNTILALPGAYGYGACAGPGSIAVGAYAGAGCRSNQQSSTR